MYSFLCGPKRSHTASKVTTPLCAEPDPQLHWVSPFVSVWHFWCCASRRPLFLRPCRILYLASSWLSYESIQFSNSSPEARKSSIGTSTFVLLVNLLTETAFLEKIKVGYSNMQWIALPSIWGLAIMKRCKHASRGRRMQDYDMNIVLSTKFYYLKELQ